MFLFFIAAYFLIPKVVVYLRMPLTVKTTFCEQLISPCIKHRGDELTRSWVAVKIQEIDDISLTQLLFFGGGVKGSKSPLHHMVAQDYITFTTEPVCVFLTAPADAGKELLIEIRYYKV